MRGDLSIVIVSVAAVGGGEQPRVVGGGGGSEGFRQEENFQTTSFKLSGAPEFILIYLVVTNCNLNQAQQEDKLFTAIKKLSVYMLVSKPCEYTC